MSDRTEALFNELLDLYQASRIEVRALREMLTEHKILDEAELKQRMKDVRMEEFLELKAESYRRVFAKAIERGPKQ